MFTLSINTANAAFADAEGNPDPYARNREVARILRTAAKALEDDVAASSLQDSNGNVVGALGFDD